jgi:tripartite-type tricarboxylate transporter receptor subunit TctC
MMTLRTEKSRSSCAVICALAFSLAAAAFDVAAQTFPNKPVRFLIGFAAGGPTDFLARVIGQKLAEITGQPVVVDNRPGANGLVAADLVIKAPPDGHTLFQSSSGLLAFSQFLYPNQTLDPFKEFAAVTQAAAVPEILVAHPALPVKTVKELVALAKSRPGQINYASAGAGGMPQLAMESFNMAAGIKTVHIPYKGAAPAVTDVIGGQVQLTMLDVPVLLPHIKSGKLRALAIATNKRTTLLPDVPTMREAGYPTVNADNWQGIVVAAATPKDIVARLNALLAKAIQSPDTRERLASQGLTPVGSSPEEFAAFWRAENEKWGKVIKAAGIKGEYRREE